METLARCFRLLTHRPRRFVTKKYVRQNRRVTRLDSIGGTTALLPDDNRWVNEHRGEQTVEEGAVEPVRLALLSDDGPTGGFFEKDNEFPW